MSNKGKIVLLGTVRNQLLYSGKSAEDFKKIQTSFNKERQSLGIWGGDYKQTQVGDLDNAISKPEDYLAFPFRHLTATIVGADSWKATEFTDAVLKEAAKLLTNKPVMVNHEMETGNIVGVNGDIKFVKAKKGVPGGLEGPIWIDGKLHQDLTRKLTAFPVPHIQSVSVTVSYEWKASHEFKNDEGEVDNYLFRRKLGTYVDGKMVRRIVTKITNFYETSLVWLGADPYAKILKEDGTPLNVEHSAIVKKSSYDNDPLAKYYEEDGLLFISNDSLSKENITNLKLNAKESFSKKGKLEANKNKNENESIMYKEIVEALALKLGVELETVTESSVGSLNIVEATKLASYKKAITDVTKLEGEKTSLEAEKTVLEGSIEKFEKICKVEDLEDLDKEVSLGSVVTVAKYGANVLEVKRKKCITDYKLSVKEGEPSEAVIKTIEEANTEALDGFLKQYGDTVYEQFGATCTKCESSDNISFRTTQEPEGKETDEPEINTGGMSKHFLGL